MSARRGSVEKRFKKPSMPVNNNISVVLVEPQSAGNVGSVARVMRNTGFGSLVLVKPCEYLNNDGYSMACNACDLLFGAQVYPAIDEAVKDSAIVVGTTRRIGKIRYPVMTLDEAAPKLLEMGVKNRVSLLFGREDKGLKNEEIGLCDILLEVPTHPDYPSLNLSHAVFAVLYRLFTMAAPKGPVISAVPHAQVEQMYLHMEQALRGLGYGEKGGEYLLATIMRSFRRLFGRTGLMQKEVNMLRGIFTQIEDRVK